MVPTDEEEAQGYEFEAPTPLVKVLVGDPEHRKVYDVSDVPFLVSASIKPSLF
jgi:hypothetical protein